MKKVLVCLVLAFLVLFSAKIEKTYAVIYTVTASVVGGHGTVTPITQKIKPNARATITIKPDTGYHLDTITDNGQKMKIASPYAIPFVNEDHKVEFTFAINVYSVNASVSGGHGKVDPPTQSVTHGEKATISITPEEGYKITGIMDNGNSIGIANPLVLSNVSVNHSIVVGFVSYTVTASVVGGHGTVTPITMTVQSGGKATITIKPDVGFQINKILDNSKEVKVANPYIITGITSNRKIEVSFTTAVLTIKASVAGGHGSVSPEIVKVLYKGQTRIDINPDSGYHVTGITDNGTPIPIKNTIILTNVTIDHTIVVSFIEFIIDARMIEDHGAITPLRQTMFYGGKATITIKPDAGYKLSYVIDNGAWKSPTTPTTYVMTNVTANHLVDVYFASISFTITAIVAGGYGIATPALQTIRYGSQAKLIFTPDPGYRVTGIMDNGKTKIAWSPYVIKSVTENHTVIVTFLAYAVFASVSGGHGSISPINQYIYAGNKASIVIIPEDGYHIDKILDNDKVVPIKSPYVIQNVMENHAVDVQFAINTYTVAASVSGGHGTLTPATQTVKYCKKATISIAPENGYMIESITDNGVSVPIWNPYSVYYVTANRTIVVKFKKK